MKKVITGVMNSYNKIARTYFEGAKFFNEEIMHAELIALAKKYGFDFRGKSVLDLGCGPGGLMKKLKTLGTTPHGIDISEELLKIASERGCENLTLGSMHELGNYFAPETFDAVFSNFVLHYLPPEDKMLTIPECVQCVKTRRTLDLFILSPVLHASLVSRRNYGRVPRKNKKLLLSPAYRCVGRKRIRRITTPFPS